MHERDPVVEAHDLVLDVARLLGMQLGEHRLDQAHMLGDGPGLYLVADHHAADHATLPCGCASPLASSLNARRIPLSNAPGGRTRRSRVNRAASLVTLLRSAGRALSAMATTLAAT